MSAGLCSAAVEARVTAAACRVRAMDPQLANRKKASANGDFPDSYKQKSDADLQRLLDAGVGSVCGSAPPSRSGASEAMRYHAYTSYCRA